MRLKALCKFVIAVGRWQSEKRNDQTIYKMTQHTAPRTQSKTQTTYGFFMSVERPKDSQSTQMAAMYYVKTSLE